MGGRFQVRQVEDGFGVWDTAVGGWRSVQNLSRAAADNLAADLDLQYGPYGIRLASEVRRCEPPRSVEARNWGAAGVLEVWVREGGRWWGRVRDGDGGRRWVPSDDLRPQIGPPG